MSCPASSVFGFGVILAFPSCQSVFKLFNYFRLLIEGFAVPIQPVIDFVQPVLNLVQPLLHLVNAHLQAFDIFLR
jgi:hypothetical protein